MNINGHGKSFPDNRLTFWVSKVCGLKLQSSSETRLAMLRTWNGIDFVLGLDNY